MKSLIFFCSLFILISCDPAHDIDYIVSNNTGHKVIILSKNRYENVEKIDELSNGLRLIILNDGGIGRSNCSYLNNLDSIYLFQSLKISLENGKLYSKDPLSVSNWVKNYDDENYSVNLNLLESDFK